MSGKRWGDVLDDDSDEEDNVLTQTTQVSAAGAGAFAGGDGEIVIPPTHKSRVDAKGVQVVTSYKQLPGSQQLLKTVTKVKVTYQKVKEAKAIDVRRKWAKFGEAVNDGMDDKSRSTILSKEDIYMEDPNADTDLQDEDPAAAIAGNLNAFWEKQQRRERERKEGLANLDTLGSGDPGQGADGGGWNVVAKGGGLGAAGAAAGKYIPPSQRAAMAAGGVSSLGMRAAVPERRDDLNTIRVTNISENTTEADLQDLFKPFGRISRVYLAKDKETLQSRGFAFVSFVNKDDAARAMEKLQGYGYDHLILKLEWARPNAPKDPASSGTEFRSGYGKALAQDTTKSVSYASNLTR
jgi:translation initiation factor 3 subunit G